MYANLGCKGYETSLSQCSMDVYPSLQCSRSQIAGVLCRDSKYSLPYCNSCHSFTIIVCTEGDIKLMGGTSPNEGTVVICRNSLWGVIAQQSWDVNDAIVTCRQLNYTNSGKYHDLFIIINTFDHSLKVQWLELIPIMVNLI